MIFIRQVLLYFIMKTQRKRWF